MNTVLLWTECQQAAFTGVNRRLRAIRKGSHHGYGKAQDNVKDWGDDIESAAAEMAAAKATGRFWSDTPDPDYDGDIGPGEQVRHTARPNGSLLLHAEDEDDHKYILVVGVLPALHVVGWCFGREGKREEFWDTKKTGRPCYFVPQASLRPIETFDD